MEAKAPQDKRLRALDLYCCQGGAARGLQRAGFYVVGVDIKHQPRYCGDEFFQADALTFPLEGFDFIWASPPCQAGSIVTPKAHREKHPNLIPATRARLVGAGVPYVIENVAGMRRHLDSPVKLCGSMFGLRCFRHRYFEVWPALAFLTPPCRHDFRPLLVTTAGCNSRRSGNFKSTKNALEAYGIDWMSGAGLKEAVPPAYAEFLGCQVMQYLEALRERAA